MNGNEEAHKLYRLWTTVTGRWTRRVWEQYPGLLELFWILPSLSPTIDPVSRSGRMRLKSRRETKAPRLGLSHFDLLDSRNGRSGRVYHPLARLHSKCMTDSHCRVE